jgi:hypothetical protein
LSAELTVTRRWSLWLFPDGVSPEQAPSAGLPATAVELEQLSEGTYKALQQAHEQLTAQHIELAKQYGLLLERLAEREGDDAAAAGRTAVDAAIERARARQRG